MKTEWKPGDVALVTSWRGERQIAFRCGRVEGQPTWCVLDGTDTRGLGDDEIEAVRPVVVIDPEDRQQIDRLVGLFENLRGESLFSKDDDHLQAALRELANPGPQEPVGLGAVIEGANGIHYVRHWPAETDMTHPWHAVDRSNRLPRLTWKYSELNVVKVLSEGVSE